jgi:hypothetical protein
MTRGERESNCIVRDLMALEERISVAVYVER